MYIFSSTPLSYYKYIFILKLQKKFVAVYPLHLAQDEEIHCIT